MRSLALDAEALYGELARGERGRAGGGARVSIAVVAGA